MLCVMLFVASCQLTPSRHFIRKLQVKIFSFPREKIIFLQIFRDQPNLSGIPSMYDPWFIGGAFVEAAGVLPLGERDPQLLSQMPPMAEPFVHPLSPPSLSSLILCVTATAAADVRLSAPGFAIGVARRRGLCDKGHQLDRPSHGLKAQRNHSPSPPHHHLVFVAVVFIATLALRVVLLWDSRFERHLIVVFILLAVVLASSRPLRWSEQLGAGGVPRPHVHSELPQHFRLQVELHGLT
jgi:hypothetical protein